MTVEEMLIEARYQFYTRGGRLTVLQDDDSAAQEDANPIQVLPSRVEMRRQPGCTATKPIDAWCDWINSYRESLGQDERRRRLEAWRQAERRASLRA